jgi:geranylgeranyl pyrophosphate synthase|tara:strand:- start:572 stop:964 length:393 start_codon:yes stop_codon:yes gene_type:complete
MKQFSMFGDEPVKDDGNKYTKGVGSPLYEPKNKCPDLLELLDHTKTDQLINEIYNSNVTAAEKSFLIQAARRHSVFYYSKIADYYANCSEEMQKLMEKSALIIIDFEQAIELGYLELSNKVVQQYLEHNE